MRKKLYLAAILTVFTCTGCGNLVPDLTHVNNDIAAQYVADALLRNDKNYDEGLDYDHSVLQPTEKPEPKEEPQTETDQNGTGNNGSGKNGTSNGNNGNSSGQSGTDTSLKSVSVTDIYGVKGVAVSPTSYKLKSSYGSSAYQILPHTGKRLAVVYFTISNKTKKKKRVNLAAKDVSAELLINGANIGKPLLSFADNDLQSFDTTLDAGKRKQGVLLFEVAKKTKVSDVEIRFTSGSKEAKQTVK